MRINVRNLVKELLENKNLIVNYNELNDGGFDLSVRINEELAGETWYELKKVDCPHCASTNVKVLYGTINTDNSHYTKHYICEDCHKEFNV